MSLKKIERCATIFVKLNLCAGKMVSNISNFFMKTDNVCDYIPAVSTLSNLVDLFQKCVVLPRMSKQSIVNSHYYTHLKNKSILRCIILLIPVIGNVIVGIYDFANRKYNDKDYMLAAVRLDGRALARASERLKDDWDVVLAAVQQYVWAALDNASDRLKDNGDFMRAAVQENSSAVVYASDRLKDNRDFMLVAVQKNVRAALDNASDRLKDDENFMLAAVRKYTRAFDYASDRLKNDRNFVLAAVRENGWILPYVSDQFKNDREIARAAVQQDGSAITCIGEQLRQELELGQKAV